MLLYTYFYTHSLINKFRYYARIIKKGYVSLANLIVANSRKRASQDLDRLVYRQRPSSMLISPARCSRCDLLSDRDEAILTKTKSSDRRREEARKRIFCQLQLLGNHLDAPSSIHAARSHLPSALLLPPASFSLSTIFTYVSSPTIFSMLIFFIIKLVKLEDCV